MWGWCDCSWNMLIKPFLSHSIFYASCTCLLVIGNQQSYESRATLEISLHFSFFSPRNKAILLNPERLVPEAIWPSNSPITWWLLVFYLVGPREKNKEKSFPPTPPKRNHRPRLDYVTRPGTPRKEKKKRERSPSATSPLSTHTFSTKVNFGHINTKFTFSTHQLHTVAKVPNK